MNGLRSVAEVVAKLQDKGFAGPHVVQVNKGTPEKPRWLDVIEWHEAVRMLNEAFGPFGWDGEIVGSSYCAETGVYTVDMTLTGRALDDETGEVLTLKRPGRGVGYVRESARTTEPEHDRQAHGAKSDAITNATKALGDGFGLFLYQKGQQQQQARPAAPVGEGLGNAAPAPANGGWDGSMKQAQTRAGKAVTVPTYVGEKGFPSVAQFFKLTKEGGYTAESLAQAPFAEWKAKMDELMGGGNGGRYPFSQGDQPF